MPSLTIVLDHDLPRAVAQRRVEVLLDQLHQHYAGKHDRLTKHWSGPVLNFRIDRGLLSVTGTASVQERAMTIEVNLPWTLAFWKGRIREVVEQEGRRLLGN